MLPVGCAYQFNSKRKVAFVNLLIIIYLKYYVADVS